MGSTIRLASELPAPAQPLSWEEEQYFVARRFFPNAGSSSLCRELRHGITLSRKWYVQRRRYAWHAIRDDGYGVQWRGLGFDTATAAYVDAELRQWGEV